MSASLVGSEMCIRDSEWPAAAGSGGARLPASAGDERRSPQGARQCRSACLLYTSDAADDM
eukprot:2798263-Alexandrium_andersonii.AAC.1